jgi:hypothetical protein
MEKMRLFQAACTVAMLAAVPALAQAPANDSSTAPSSPTGAASTAPADNASPPATGHAMHGSAMRHRTGMKRGTSDTSQNDAVDRLNDQSFQAAQQGQTFTGGGSDAGSPAAPPMGGGGASGGAMPPGRAAPAPGSTGGVSKP